MSLTRPGDKFTDAAKMEAAWKFIKTMADTAGCTADELKRLFHPKIIDAAVEAAAMEQQT